MRLAKRKQKDPTMVHTHCSCAGPTTTTRKNNNKKDAHYLSSVAQQLQWQQLETEKVSRDAAAVVVHNESFSLSLSFTFFCAEPRHIIFLAA